MTLPMPTHPFDATTMRLPNLLVQTQYATLQELVDALPGGDHADPARFTELARFLLLLDSGATALRTAGICDLFASPMKGTQYADGAVPRGVGDIPPTVAEGAPTETDVAPPSPSPDPAEVGAALLSQLVNCWEAIKTKTKEKSFSTAGLLHAATPRLVHTTADPFVVTLGVNHIFHLDKLRRETHRANVRWAMQQIVPGEYDLAFVHSATLVPEESDPPALPAGLPANWTGADLNAAMTRWQISKNRLELASHLGPTTINTALRDGPVSAATRSKIARVFGLLAEITPQRLRAYRERHDLTQRELAARFGVSSWTISQIELGRMPPSTHLLPLADILRAEERAEEEAA